VSAVRWGILSTAKINAALLGGARETSAVEVVAVGSRDRERGEAFAAEHGIGRVHGSYDELLADDEVEAVYIPLPNSMHLPWAERALEAGKHVLCEKPLSAHPERVEAAFDVAERSGRLLMEAFMWRFHPQTELVSRAVADGTVGAVRTIRAAFGFSLPDLGNVRWSGELEGGALMDVGCYCVSALRLLGGEPERVSAERVDGGSGVDGRLAGVWRLPGDVLGLLDCGLDVAPRMAIEVVGEGARSSPTTPGTAAPRASSSRGRAHRSRCRSRRRRRTHTGSSSKTSRPRSAARARRGSAARTPSGRRGRSPRCTGRRLRDGRWRSRSCFGRRRWRRPRALTP
jgi:D-xylose 1-dehydrogenase (NADP+, D-xylono-1,5-lactone-forming)